MPSFASQKTADGLQKRTGLTVAAAKEAFDKFGYTGGLVSFVQNYGDLPDDFFSDRTVAVKDAASINEEVRVLYAKAREIKSATSKADKDVWKAVEAAVTSVTAAPVKGAATDSTADVKNSAEKSTAPATSPFGSAPGASAASPFKSAFGAPTAWTSAPVKSAFGAAVAPAAQTGKQQSVLGDAKQQSVDKKSGEPSEKAASETKAPQSSVLGAADAKPAAPAAPAFKSVFGAPSAPAASPFKSAFGAPLPPAAQTGKQQSVLGDAKQQSVDKKPGEPSEKAASETKAPQSSVLGAADAKPAAPAAPAFKSVFGAPSAPAASPFKSAFGALSTGSAPSGTSAFASAFSGGTTTSAFGGPANPSEMPKPSGGSVFASAFAPQGPAGGAGSAAGFKSAFNVTASAAAVEKPVVSTQAASTPPPATNAADASKPTGFGFGFGTDGAPAASGAGATTFQFGTAATQASSPAQDAAAEPEPEKVPRKPAVLCEAKHFTGPFLDMPNFWKEEVVGRAPLLNKDNDFLQAHRDELRPRLLKWVEKATFHMHPVQYVEIENEDDEVVRVIIKDADRTFFAPEHRQKMVSFLNAMFNEFNAYGQAMSYLAGLCMLALSEEETAAILRFVSKEYIKGHWAAEAVGFATSAWVVEHFMKKIVPDVAAHLEQLKFWPDTYLQKILTGLCIHVLDFEDLFVFLDAFMGQGFQYLVRFCIAIVEHFHSDILSITDSSQANQLYEIMRLDSHMADRQDIHAILKRAPNIDLGEDGDQIDVIRSTVYTLKIEPRMKRAPKVPTFEPCELCQKNRPVWFCDEFGAVCDACREAHPEEKYEVF